MLGKTLPLRKQATITDNWLKERLDSILPKIMKREGFDMWIVISREYNEDPVIMSLLPAKMLSSTRRTILLYSLQKDGKVKKMNITRSGIGLDDVYESVWDESMESQWKSLLNIVSRENPGTIGVNYSYNFAFGDGLTNTQYNALMKALGPTYSKRVKSAENLALGWLEERTPSEISAYAGINQIAHEIISTAFSPKIVHPGITSANDVAWWIRQKIRDIGLSAWFHPTIMIQRKNHNIVNSSEVILQGDLLHCDVGLKYLGLCTDTQQHAYVLKLGEHDAPKGLVNALALGNKLQNIVCEEFVSERTGNEILLSSLMKAKNQGIKASVYTHPIGFHGHGAGPTIGLFNKQESIPYKGDYKLYNNTCYALELNIQDNIPEWNNQEVMIALEQTVVFTNDSVSYLDKRQTKLHLI